MISIQIDNSQGGVGDGVSPEGLPLKVLILSDPQSGIRVIAPMTHEFATTIASGLVGHPVIMTPTDNGIVTP